MADVGPFDVKNILSRGERKTFQTRFAPNDDVREEQRLKK